MRKCTVVNKYKEDFDVYIGRGSKWGNPFKMRDRSDEERDRVCKLYEEWFWTTELPFQIHELRGKRLGCFCKPKPCHGDFLAELANRLEEPDPKTLVYICSHCNYNQTETEIDLSILTEKTDRGWNIYCPRCTTMRDSSEFIVREI